MTESTEELIEDQDPRDEQTISNGVGPRRWTRSTVSAEVPAPVGNSTGHHSQAQMQMVFALGTLDYDLVSEARRDSYVQAMGSGKDPGSHQQMLEHLGNHPHEATGITWTLNLDATPIYAIQPAGPYAAEVYNQLRECLKEQDVAGVQRVSVPGFVAGQAHLMTGHSVPVIIPELRGMYNWSTEDLVRHVRDNLAAKANGQTSETKAKSRKKVGSTETEKLDSHIRSFLDRVYHELHNLGASPQERALNYAATNAYQAAEVLAGAIAENMELDTVDVERSPVCRPDSDCWDIKLTFFDPKHKDTVARKVYRFTVDVSDVIPVTVGDTRSWSVF